MPTLFKYKTRFLQSGSPETQDISFLIQNRIALQHEYNDLKRLIERNDKRPLAPKTLAWFRDVSTMMRQYNYKAPDEKKLITLDNARKRTTDLNMWRLNSRFAIITAGAALQFSRFTQLLELISQQEVNPAVLDAPIGIYSVLSIGIFGLRFLINLIDIIQNLVRASEEEKDKLPFLYRLYVELDKHEYQLGNDLVWGLINFFTNFPRFLHLTPPVANYVMGSFLVFDMLWMGRSLYKERARFALQRADYVRLISELKMNETENELIIKDVERQSRELDYREANLTWTLAFYVGAGLLLLGGFSAAILLSPPAFVPLCFLICNIGIAMYFTGEHFGSWIEKRMIHQDEKSLVSKANATAELYKLGREMLEYTFVPLIIMAVFTVSWPAALALTLTYIALKISPNETVRDSLKTLPTLVSLPTLFADKVSKHEKQSTNDDAEIELLIDCNTNS